jgi:uncharacterized protein (DUF1800 family)
VHGKHAIRPLVEAILMHPDFYEGPRMVKPPVVYVAGMLRATGKGIDRDDWTWICDLAGQLLFQPPNVAGWDETRWLDTATFRGRWMAANTVLDGLAIDPDAEPAASIEPAPDAVNAAVKFWGDPSISNETRAALERFATDAGALADKKWKVGSYGVLRQNALRILVATSPDLQTC